jgi:type IV secretion system protein VirB6
MQWHIFAQIWQYVGQPLNTLITAVYTGMFAYVSPGFKGAVVLFMSLCGGMVASGKMGSIRQDWLPILIRIAFIGAISNVTFFNTVIRDTMLHRVPEGLINTIAAAGGAQNLTNANVPETFDKTFIDAMASGIKVAQDSSGGGFAVAIARAIFIYVIYLPLAAVAVFIAFAIWFSAQFLLSMVVAVGPIFIAFLAFPATKRYGDMWISAGLGMGLLQALVMLALSMIIAVETFLVKGILTMNTGAADASTSQIVMLIAAVAVYLLFAYVIKQIPGLTTAMIGGAHAQLSGFTQSMFDRQLSAANNNMKQLESRAANAAARGINAASERMGIGLRLPVSPPGIPLGRRGRA